MDMKKFTNTLSPFVMLLVPLFLLLGVLAMNSTNKVPAGKQKASVKLEIPALKDFIQAAVK
jgi:hypothetical protein